MLDVADAYAGGRVVSVLEGGYNTGILAGCVALHLQTLLDRDSSDGAAPDHFVFKAAGNSPLGSRLACGLCRACRKLSNDHAQRSFRG